MSRAFLRVLAADTAARYDAADPYARHFAAGKIRGDPVFEWLLARGLISDGARVLDLGCGQGLVAALLETAAARRARGEWPAHWPAPARVASFRGIDLAKRDVERARRASLDRAHFIEGDIRDVEFGHADTVVILDVLHYLDPAAQDDVLARARASLEEGGMLLLRVADAGAGLRFAFTEWSDRIATLLKGHGLPRMSFRAAARWRRDLEALGFQVESAAMSAGTPFANVLLAARYHS